MIPPSVLILLLVVRYRPTHICAIASIVRSVPFGPREATRTMAPPASAAGAAAPATPASSNNKRSRDDEEEQLRKQLKGHLHRVTKREPLDATYKFLIASGSARPPFIPKDRLYKRLPAELRHTTETLMLQPGGNDPNLPGKKIGDDREALDEEAMRSALTLRAAKRHEQEALALAALKAPPRGVRLPPGWDVTTHRNRLEGMALGLQEKEIKQKNKVERARLAQIAKAKMEAAEREAAAKGRTIATAAGGAVAEAAMQAKALAKAEEELALKKQRDRENEERLRRIERERQRTEERRVREEEERREAEEAKAELERRQRMAETPKEALFRLYNPVFQILWDMEFPALGNSNPFRIVIDKDTCVQMGVPDYCKVIAKPMNLTYVQEKVENRSYLTLQEFFSDIELIISNALTYNSDPRNPYHVAALEFRKRYRKAAKRVVQSVQQKK